MFLEMKDILRGEEKKSKEQAGVEITKSLRQMSQDGRKHVCARGPTDDRSVFAAREDTLKSTRHKM